MIKVTVEDTEAGTVETAEFDDDYLLLVAGSCYLANRTAHRNGTHVLTVKNATKTPYTLSVDFQQPPEGDHDA